MFRTMQIQRLGASPHNSCTIRTRARMTKVHRLCTRAVGITPSFALKLKRSSANTLGCISV